MNRRTFLAWLGGTAAGVAAAPYLDLDRILWTPEARTIVIPAARGLWTPTSLQCGDVFTLEGQYALNPITNTFTPFLQQFVITANVSAGDVAASHIWPSLAIAAPSVKRAKIRPMESWMLRPDAV